MKLKVGDWVIFKTHEDPIPQQVVEIGDNFSEFPGRVRTTGMLQWISKNDLVLVRRPGDFNEDNHNGVLRYTSGNVQSDNAFDSFLYLLMRDHLPPGKVETILREVFDDKQPSGFTNGWLAEYARYVRTRLQGGNN